MKLDRPTHYRVVCCSLYMRDLVELDRKIALLKERGWTAANRSHLIRIALDRLSDDDLAAIATEQRGLRQQRRIA